MIFISIRTSASVCGAEKPFGTIQTECDYWMVPKGFSTPYKNLSVPYKQNVNIYISLLNGTKRCFRYHASAQTDTETDAFQEPLH